MEVAHLIATHILQTRAGHMAALGCKGGKKCSWSCVSVEKVRWLVKTYQCVCDSTYMDNPLNNSLQYVSPLKQRE